METAQHRTNLDSGSGHELLPGDGVACPLCVRRVFAAALPAGGDPRSRGALEGRPRYEPADAWVDR